MNYKMNFATKTLTITKEFERKALIPNSEESNTLIHLRSICPDLKITYRIGSPNKITRGLTYSKMERYIRLFENANELLITFSTIKDIARTQNNAYGYVYKWFMTQFPDFGDIPEIHDGKLFAEVVDYSSFVNMNENKRIESAA